MSNYKDTFSSNKKKSTKRIRHGKSTLFACVGFIFLFVLLAIFGLGDNFKSVQKMRFGIDIRGGVEAIFEPQGLDRKATAAELESARNIIDIRLDNKYITDREVTIDKDGGYIIVRFPWKSDEKNYNPEQAIQEIGAMAQLSFRDPQGNIMLDGKHVVSSSASRRTNNVTTDNVVELIFDKEGAKLFEEATGKLIGKPMSIYMDNDLISAPQVNSKITGGKAVIQNIKTYEEAKNLSEKINAGALPFSLTTSSFRTISPTLGNNALNVMLVAGAIAFVFVCIFMIGIYKLPGFVACLVLILQMVLQLLAISVPQYTLTLPGIAGIILSVGMAVDANIIIAERVSEELKKGATYRSAVTNGYKNAFSSVLDGNVTTAAVAIILMIFGSGAMLSFGYTLLIGMIVNVLVGVFLSKTILLSFLEMDRFNEQKYFREQKERKPLKIYQNKWIFLIISGTIFIVGIVGVIIKGVHLDTQFTGGAVLEYSITGNVDTETVRSKVSDVTNRPTTVQITKDNITDSSSVIITLAGTSGLNVAEQEKITGAVKGISDDLNAKLAQTYVVEPYIGAKALKNAVMAVVISIIFIIIYVWIRFSGLTSGITATLALVHDIITVFFVFVIFGIPLNDAFVAVVLTIIGYSINDTIVIYDRVRENRKKNPKQDFIELMNESNTQTLHRSVNTSITTAVCVLIMLIASIIFRIDSIKVFTLPMLFGLISGCYSSICIAGVLWTMWEKRKR
ncbi:protein translocase subunit SecDF [Lachnoclostridium phytofermentans]|uniref:Multifunctional fusion protein n=1 Tax=Lachnoclostridium phytofermentans (strain ATCC 700394 / DSM 18823 / ISDg) TaxID=357809 RepID=A9KJU8_LACP7|nr:protein translocase subunit SecDF [Lachnoclostridium phytofermentans]ABX41103.1 protein-export membrane protein, SecD/SecF family [Lachnoclostridium phytofermentans ISDg]